MKSVYQRMYGYICVLLLLQEFHVVMATDQSLTRLPFSDQTSSHHSSHDKHSKKTLSDPALAETSTPITHKADEGKKNTIDKNTLDAYDKKMHTPTKQSSPGNITTGFTITDDSRREIHKRSAHPDVSVVQNHLRSLADKFSAQNEDLISRTMEYISNCSEDHLEDIQDYGSAKTPTGIMTRLMLAILYTLADCEESSREILVDVIEEVEKETVVDVLETLLEIAVEIDNPESPKTSKGAEHGEVEDEDEEYDNTDPDEDDFLSELLTENVLNTQEMMKLMDLLADGYQFENVTELEDAVSELEEFELDELLDRPNYKWITYPVNSRVNTTKLGDSVLDSVVNNLNSETTENLIREMTIPVEIDSETRLLVIYDESSRQLLTITTDGDLALHEYGESDLQNQLWIHSKGQIFNVGFHLALVSESDENMTTPLSLGKVDEVTHWRLYGGHLAYGRNNDCFLRISSENNQDSNDPYQQDIVVDCGIDVTDTDVHVVSFKDVNTPERFLQEIDRPISLLASILEKFTNAKALIFMHMLTFIIQSYMPYYKKPTYSTADSITLDSTFFIKNSHTPCQLLGHSHGHNGTARLVFEEFSETSMEFQLWYWKDNQILNVGSHSALEVNNSITHSEHSLGVPRFLRLWGYNEGSIFILNNRSCALKVDKLTEQLDVVCNFYNTTTTSHEQWTLVPFDKPNFNNFVDVVCMYFIQSSLWPCEFMTFVANISSPLLFPLADNIFTQLWYMSNGRLVHVETGLALSRVDSSGTLRMQPLNASNLTHWTIESGQIIQKNSSIVVTVDTEDNGILFARQNNHSQTQLWKLASVKDASSNNESLTCKDDISNSLKSFVIRNNNIPACQLLTVQENNGTFTLKMKHYDEANLEGHLWVMHNDVIINVKSGLSLQPQMSDNIDESRIIELGQLHAFQHTQMWTFDNSNVLRWKPNPNCFMDYEINRETYIGTTVLNCDWQKRSNSAWTFTDLPKNETDLADTLNFMCFYFLRSNSEPCQYITADLETGGIYVRPLAQSLLEKQLWYWNERTLVLATTGQALGLANNITIEEYPWLSLKLPEHEDILDSWKFVNHRLLSQSDNVYLAVQLYEDGRIYASSKEHENNLNVSFVNYDAFLQGNGDSSCPVPINDNTTFYFIRSHLDSCLLLTGAGVGQAPTFKHFDQDDIESQLWYYGNNHIINLKTNLAIHAEVKSQIISRSRVVMREYYKYSNYQKWVISDTMIYYGTLTSCVLGVDTQANGKTVQVWCRSDGEYTIDNRWDIIEFDDDASYMEEITCMFFIRHEVVPCELLTLVNGSLKLRPISDDLINDQVWYWSGECIVNAASGLVLSVSESDEVYLGPKLEQNVSQTWHRDGTHLLSNEMFGADEFDRLNPLKIGMDNKVMTLDQDTGKIVLLFRMTAIIQYGSDNIKWNFVDLEDGLNTPSLLYCEENLASPTVYLIRSEKDPCHVLSEHTNGQVSLVKAGNEHINQAWVRIRRHIMSANTGNVLGVDVFQNGEQVTTRMRYEHEVNQHWALSGSSIRMTMSDNIKLLDSYGDVCVWKPDNSDGQKWKWLSVNAVKDDEKLLRCSKCYNKKEEKANEVMQYIPIFGLFYTLIRAPVYAAKGCDEVARQTMIDFGIGLALEIPAALVTVLSGGTASGLAYGIKTAAQTGIKAGLKAALKFFTSSIKLALRQALNAGKTLLKQGLKKTVITLSKKGLSNLKYTLKSNLRTIRYLPKTTKTFVVKSSSTVKTVSTKLYNRIRSTSFGTLKSSIPNGLRKIPSVLKKKLNKIGNSLAEKAERKIKRLDDLKKNKPTSHVRCKRAGGNVCNGPFQNAGPKTSSYDDLIKKAPAYVPTPSQEVSRNFDSLLTKARQNSNRNLGDTQNAHYGLSYADSGFDTTSVHGKFLKNVDEAPLDKNYKAIDDVDRSLWYNTAHTEQPLVKDMNKAIAKKCLEKKPCELYLWTKWSPCMKNTYTVKNTVVAAKSCFAMLLETCYHHKHNTPGFKGCHIGFQDFYGITGKKAKDAKKEFLSEMASLKETVKVLQKNADSLISDAKKNMQSFIKFYQVAAPV